MLTPCKTLHNTTLSTHDPEQTVTSRADAIGTRKIRHSVTDARPGDAARYTICAPGSHTSRQRPLPHSGDDTLPPPHAQGSKRRKYSAVPENPLENLRAEAMFVCPFEGCNKRYHYNKNLNAHYRTHGDDLPHVCPLEDCRQRFTQQSELKTHLRTHTRKKTYVCPYDTCGQRFTQQPDLKTHLLTHSGEKPYGCPYETCGRRFTRRSHLKPHLRTHTGEKPYVCPHQSCGRRFSQQSNLKTHLRTHTQERPYVCPETVCQKRFKQRIDLQDHMRTHTGERPWHCPHEDCEWRFKLHSGLKKHLLTHSSASGQLSSNRKRQYNGGIVTSTNPGAYLQPTSESSPVAALWQTVNCPRQEVIRATTTLKPAAGHSSLPLPFIRTGGESDGQPQDLLLPHDSNAAHRSPPSQPLLPEPAAIQPAASTASVSTLPVLAASASPEPMTIWQWLAQPSGACGTCDCSPTTNSVEEQEFWQWLQSPPAEVSMSFNKGSARVPTEDELARLLNFPDPPGPGW